MALNQHHGDGLNPIACDTCDKTRRSKEGWVAAFFWQGDSRRHSEVLDPQLPSMAVRRHLEPRGIDRTPVERAALPGSWLDNSTRLHRPAAATRS